MSGCWTKRPRRTDQPTREIHFGWRRIYAALGRVPPGANVSLGGSDDDLTLAEAFYTELARDIDTLAGVAATTMYRDQGWRFLELGRCAPGAGHRPSSTCW